MAAKKQKPTVAVYLAVPDGFTARTLFKAAAAKFDALRTNDLGAFSRAKRADVTVVDDRHRPLLFLAVLEGRTEIVERL